MSELKINHCPFCGYEAEISVNYGGMYFIYCLNTENCGASQTVFPTAEEAVKAWNKRSRAKKGES